MPLPLIALVVLALCVALWVCLAYRDGLRWSDVTEALAFAVRRWRTHWR